MIHVESVLINQAHFNRRFEGVTGKGVFNMRIAIIGFGIAGASSLIQISKQLNLTADDQVDIYEPRPRLGGGMPYAEDDDAIVINSFPKSLSLDFDNANDYIEWSKAHHPEIDVENIFSPRTIYGEYVEDYIQPYLAKEWVHHIQDSVIDVRVVDADNQPIYNRQNDQALAYQTFTEALGWSEAYDAIFFCIGHPPYKDPYQLDGQENYIQDPYPFNDHLSTVGQGQRVGIVGSGLTTIDLVNYFVKHDLVKDVELSIYFRNNPIKSVIQRETQENFYHSFSEEWIADNLAIHHGTIPISLIVNTIKSDLETNNIDYKHVWDTYLQGTVSSASKGTAQDDEDFRRFQGFFRTFYGVLHRLLTCISQEDKAYFFTELGHITRLIYTQAPKESIEMMVHLVENGQLHLRAGLKDIQAQADGTFQVSTPDEDYAADLLINATGFDERLSVAKEFNPLLGNLYRRQLIVADQFDHILATNPEAQPLTPNFQVLDNVYFLGSWISTTQGPNTSVALTKQQAKRAVDHLFHHQQILVNH